MPSKKITRLSANPEGFGQTPDDLEPDMFVTEPEAQHTHSYYEDEVLGLYVGVWDTTDMIESSGPYACDEFMFLLEGEVRIKNSKSGEMERATAGEPFLIPRGYDCQWHQKGYLKKFFLISENPNEPVPTSPVFEGIIVPGIGDPMEPLDEASPFLVSGNGNKQRQHVCYQDCTGKFSVGTWESGPFQSELRPFQSHFFAYVQAGSLTLTDECGEQHSFNAGDAFFVPQGVVCRANSNSSELTRLFYANLAG
jgi:uncharacterized cupin superfamily protein